MALTLASLASSKNDALSSRALPARAQSTRSRGRSAVWLALTAALAIGLSGAVPLAQAQTSSAATHATAAAASPIGTWKTIDDTTHEPRALIRIYAEPDGSLSGKIIKVLDKDANLEKRCDKCTDDRKDQLIQGLRIVDKMRANGDVWDQGRILDPENGKLYRCKMALADGGRNLIVRGYIGISLLGRSQTWIRDDSATQ